MCYYGGRIRIEPDWNVKAKMFDIAQIYELTEEMLNEDLSSDIPDYLLE